MVQFQKVLLLITRLYTFVKQSKTCDLKIYNLLKYGELIFKLKQCWFNHTF